MTTLKESWEKFEHDMQGFLATAPSEKSRAFMLRVMRCSFFAGAGSYMYCGLALAKLTDQQAEAGFDHLEQEVLEERDRIAQEMLAILEAKGRPN